MNNADWYNENELRSYPFINLDDRKGARASSSSAFLIPDSTIVDFGTVFGPGIGYRASQHFVWLAEIARTGDMVTFSFRTNVPALADYVLRFTRTSNDTRFVHSREVATSTTSASSTACQELIWEGFLVTGELGDLLTQLADGETLSPLLAADLQVEPATIIGLGDTRVTSLNVANRVRTYAAAPAGCSSIATPYEPDSIVVVATCLLGEIQLQEGHNCRIIQDPTTNSITINAEYGAGLGIPCEDVPIGPEEVPGSLPLDLAEACSTLITNINGVHSPNFVIRGGQGVTVAVDPDEPSSLIVDVDLHDMDVCHEEASSSSLSEASDG